jgi:hypothetical protein
VKRVAEDGYINGQAETSISMVVTFSRTPWTALQRPPYRRLLHPGTSLVTSHIDSKPDCINILLAALADPHSNSGGRWHTKLGLIRDVPSVKLKDDDVDRFHDIAFQPELPVVLRDIARSSPARINWFRGEHAGHKGPGPPTRTFTNHFRQFGDVPVTYEYLDLSGLTGRLLGRISRDSKMKPWWTLIQELRSGQYQQQNKANETESVAQSAFLRFQAPLQFLFDALDYNQEAIDAPFRNLYVAQQSLADLPQALREDVPPPNLVHAGRGDIYGSSLWLGLEPVYTPLHRDPNPNIFSQFLGSKHVRLLRPELGQEIYNEVQRRLGQSPDSGRIRGEEMLGGKEAPLLYEAMWASDARVGQLYEESELSRDGDLWEAEVGAGDGIFIPKGWWHTLIGRNGNGVLNASANWWFR